MHVDIQMTIVAVDLRSRGGARSAVCEGDFIGPHQVNSAQHAQQPPGIIACHGPV